MALPSTPGSSEPVEVIEHDEESGSLGDPTSKKKNLKPTSSGPVASLEGQAWAKRGNPEGLESRFTSTCADARNTATSSVVLDCCTHTRSTWLPLSP